MAQVILNLEIDEILRAFTTGAKNEGFRLLLQKGLNAMLDRESSEQLGAKRYERTDERTDSRNGVRTRELKTRIGRLTLNVPRHRNQPFRTMLFENYSRSEQALLTTMTTMVLEGVSTRKIARITEELCVSFLKHVNGGLIFVNSPILKFVNGAQKPHLRCADSLPTIRFPAVYLPFLKNQWKITWISRSVCE